MNKLSEIGDSKFKNNEKNSYDSTEIVTKYIGTNPNYKHKINWYLALPFALLHFYGFWGLIMILKERVLFATILWMFLIAQLSSIGVSVGAHRYFCHKSFKATPLLEAILIVLFSTAGSFSLVTWVRTHRLHHQYADTDADPHNVKRGLFFCYSGWILTKKNNYVRELEERVDMSDLLTNKFVMFQERYFYLMHLVFSIFIPVFVPVHFFSENWLQSYLVAYGLRYMLQLNYTFAIVVLGHGFGTRPYDKNIQPVDSWILTILSLGDGNHNFHHVFPWDYKSAEGPNLMSLIISLCVKLGLAYDLKVVSGEMIKNRITRTGDGTHHILGTDEGRSTVTAIGPLHPLNPTYRSIKDPEIVTRIIGPRSMFTSDLEENYKNLSKK